MQANGKDFIKSVSRYVYNNQWTFTNMFFRVQSRKNLDLATSLYFIINSYKNLVLTASYHVIITYLKCVSKEKTSYHSQCKSHGINTGLKFMLMYKVSQRKVLIKKHFSHSLLSYNIIKNSCFFCERYV